MQVFSSRDRRFFAMAAHLAEHATYKRYKVGCVVVYRNKVISTGCNKDVTHPLQRKYNKYRNIPDWSPHKIHAEVDAIRHVMDLDINWNEVSIYIYRKLKDRPFGMAKPCKSCMQLIRDLGIHHVFYTGETDLMYEYVE